MSSISDLKKPRINDRLHLIGVCLHEDFRERFRLLIGTTQNRPELDDPGYSKDARFAEMALKYNDQEFRISLPAKRKDAEDEIPTFISLDPNATEIY